MTQQRDTRFRSAMLDLRTSIGGGRIAVSRNMMVTNVAQKTKVNNRRDSSKRFRYGRRSQTVFSLLAFSLLVLNVRGLVTQQHQSRTRTTRFSSRSLRQRIRPYHRRTPRRFPTYQFFGAAAAESEPVIPSDDKLTPTRFFQDFCFGANLVHSQYLSFVWKYSVVQSLYVTLPIAILLWTCRIWDPTLGKAVYDLLYYPLYFIWNMSSGVASVLQLPLEALRWVVSSFPTAMIGMLQYLPNVLAVPLVQAVLFLRDTVSWISLLASNNQVISFLASATAVLAWRPAIEELEYRSILNKFFFAPRVIQAKLQQQRQSASSDTDAAAVEYIPLGTDAYMNSSFAKRDEKETKNDGNTESQKRHFLLPLADESNRILMGSILFAATRLGWLSWDPVSGDHSSPYSWTIGFVQSVMAHLSGQMLPQVRPGLQIWVLLLAIYQTVGTFLVAQNVFANLYREKGLAASVGAHVTWTISKGTIPFRILWKFGLWCTSIAGVAPIAAGQVNMKQGASSEVIQG